MGQLPKFKDLCTEEPTIDVSYTAPQADGIVDVALHREYPPSIVFVESRRKQ
jgi:hypothetical protein